MKAEDLGAIEVVRQNVTEFLRIGIESGFIEGTERKTMTLNSVWLGGNKHTVILKIIPET